VAVRSLGARASRLDPVDALRAESSPIFVFKAAPLIWQTPRIVTTTPQAARARQRLYRPFQALLLLAFGAISVGGVAITVYHSSLSREASRLSRSLGETLQLNNALRRQVGEQVDLVARYAQRPDPAHVDRFRTLDFAIARDQIRYLQLDIGNQERLTVSTIKAVQAELATSSMFFFETARGGIDEAAGTRLAAIDAQQRELLDLFDELSALQSDKVEVAIGRTRRVITAGSVFLLGGIVSFVLLTALFTVVFRKRVLHPVGTLLESARRIRRGEFSVRAPVECSDELGQLSEEFNHMAAGLADSYATLEAKVTERTQAIEQLQHQLIQSEKMSAVGQLVSGVAHELNNPLAGIIGHAQLAARNPSTAGDATAEAFEAILLQAERCRRIVADLLQFARQSETQLEPTRLNTEVARALRLRHYEMTTRNIHLECAYAIEDPVVMADPFKVQQVVLVLVNNAVDAINEAGGEGAIQVTTRCQGGDAVLEVRDTGGGIAAPARVFEPFYTTKPAGKGTGLGLSVCYGIVHEHGGEIRAENWEHGACFLVSIPCVDASVPEAPVHAHDDEESAPTSGRVLVVDDEEVLLSVQAQMLQRVGLEVDCVDNADAAMQLMQEHAFDLVICDVRMPGISGLDLYVWVTENIPELKDRFMLTSGDIVGLAKRDGQLPMPCLQKPFDFDEYVRTVVRAVAVGVAKA
jgi:signal transduction histidine kinase/CheY-like chemotaxis protein